MRKRFLTLLGLTFALPVAAVLAQQANLPKQLFAFAEPPLLLDGCGDVPEAVALADELKLRGLRIERYLQEIDRRKGDLAEAEATVRAKLVELKALKGGMSSRRVQDTTAVQNDIDRLVAVYDQMKPAEAAAVLTNLPPDFAAEILMRVQPDAGARIIAAVEPGQAAILTTHMGARNLRTR